MRMEKGLLLSDICIQRWRVRVSWTKWRTVCQQFQRLVTFAIAIATVIQQLQFRRCFENWCLFADSPLPGYENVPEASFQVRQMRRNSKLHQALISLRASLRYKRAVRSQQQCILARWRLVVRRRVDMRQWAAGATVFRASSNSTPPSCKNQWPSLLPQYTWTERMLLSRTFCCWQSKVCRRSEVRWLTRSRRLSCLSQALSGWVGAAHARKCARRWDIWVAKNLNRHGYRAQFICDCFLLQLATQHSLNTSVHMTEQCSNMHSGRGGVCNPNVSESRSAGGAMWPGADHLEGVWEAVDGGCDNEYR